MPEAVIHYNDPKVLDVLRSMSALLGFTVKRKRSEGRTSAPSEPVTEQVAAETIELDGLTVLPAHGKASDEGMDAIFKGVDARKLREQAWTRGRG